MWDIYWKIYLSFTIPYLFISITNWIIDMKTSLIQYRCYNTDKKSLDSSYAKVHSLVALNLYFFYPSLIYLTINPNNFRYDNYEYTECVWTIFIMGLIYEVCSYIIHRLL